MASIFVYGRRSDKQTSLAQFEDASLPASLLFTFDTEVVVEGSHSSIGIDRDVEIIMYEEVIVCALTDDSEVVHIGFLDTNSATEIEASDPCPLIFVSSC